MTRKVKELTITDENRDKGKTFVLTEMSAWDADRWATKAFLALANSGAQIPDDVARAGVAGLMAMGLSALTAMRYELLQPLLDELMPCIKYQHAPGQVPQAIIAGINCQIEEIATFWKLRTALLELHTGFSLAA